MKCSTFNYSSVKMFVISRSGLTAIKAYTETMCCAIKFYGFLLHYIRSTMHATQEQLIAST